MNIIIDSELKKLIPPLTEEEYAGLEESILTEGCRDALVLWGDVLVDGHNRYDICRAHGIPFQTVQREFADKNAVKLWMFENQLARRNLSDIQRIEMARNCEDAIKARAHERQLAALTQNQQDKPVVVGLPQRKARDELGEMAGVSGSTYERAVKVLDNAPEEIVEAMRSGEITINKAYQDMRREEKKQAVKQRIEDHAAVQTGVIDIEDTARKYNIIYADPPWQYWESGNKNQALHYTTMTIDEICDLPVKNIADDDCVLFLWVTYPILQDAFRVIESWGFKYSTAAFVWVKKNKQKDTPFIGCGAWTRANSELCLLATKGNVMRLDASVSQVVESPIEDHSKKPDVVRELITRLVGELPRVELFCRNPADGWDVWGNEA